MRRGRKFGDAPADPRKPDGKDRGLLFMCLNTDIARQFEFVQQTWLLNPGFATQLDEVDPLLGPAGPFSIPAIPFRRRPDVKAYVQFAGGEYFFLPSITALNYLQSL
jgi:deferrochelatase/peroxidase EfeB